MKPWLYVGCKLVCLPYGPVDNRYGETLPTPGETYTVREIVEGNAGLCVRLAEITNARRMFREGFEENAFEVQFFRPLHDNSKTIEAIKQMMRDHVAAHGHEFKLPVRA